MTPRTPKRRGRPPAHAPLPVDKARKVYRRYSNRRVYSVEKATYVTLDVLLGASKKDVLVVDAKTGKDITVFMIAVAEHEARTISLRGWARELGL